MKRALTLSVDYRRHWDAEENDGPWWPLLREFAQGALDEEVQNPEHKATITYDQKKEIVKISSSGVKLPFSILLLGESTKMDDDRTIGGYGEGMKIAMLVAVRNEIPLTIRNGADEVWIPTLESDDAFPDKQVLKVEKVRRVRLTRSFDIEVGNVKPETWMMFQSRMLLLKNQEYIPTDAGDLLTNDDERGNVYIKGVYVHKDKTLGYGYNLKHVKPDLDRRTTNSYDLRSATLEIWKSLAKMDDEKFTAFYDLLATGKGDVTNAEYLYDTALIEKLVAHFKELYGDAVPVWLKSDYDEAGRLGVKAVQVTSLLGQILGPRLPSLANFREVLSLKVIREYGVETLSARVGGYFMDAMDVLTRAAPDLVHHFPKIVEFEDGSRRFTEATENHIAEVSWKTLTSVQAAISVLIESHVNNWKDVVALGPIDKTKAIWESVVGVLIDDSRQHHTAQQPSAKNVDF